MITKFPFENEAMLDLMSKAESTFKQKRYSLAGITTVNGLVEEIKKRTGKEPVYTQTDLFSDKRYESDLGESSIRALAIFAGEDFLGTLGERAFTLDVSLAPDSLRPELPFIFAFDGLIYKGIIPGYTPEGEETILVANQSKSMKRIVMRDPYFRVDSMRLALEAAEKNGNWKDFNLNAENTAGRPLYRHDNHLLKFITYETDGLERNIDGN